MNYWKHYFIALVVFLALDALWLGVIASSLYSDQLGDLMTDDPLWAAAALFYALFVLGLLYFALIPALKSNSLKLAVKNGALFGFFTYMTYELTNYAVIRDWPAALVPIDIVWGVVLGLSVSYISYKLIKRFNI